MDLERLHILYEHLMHGELGHEVFDFYKYNSTPSLDPKWKGCGTNGCGIGECPIIWDEWEFGYHYDPVLIGNRSSSNSGTEWFGLDRPEYNHLFLPNHQKTHKYGGIILGSLATKQQVSSNIKAFIDKCYKEES